MSYQFMIDLEGTSLTAVEKHLLNHPHVGSVILFSRNFVALDQLEQLLHAIRDIRPDLIITVDQEGGVIQRLQRHGFRSLPAARVYGEIFDLAPSAGLQYAMHMGKTMAEALRSCGIHLGLAPVLDLHCDKSPIIAGLDRAFHVHPESVIQLAGAFIQGMHQAGMPAVGKHFPGHGRVAQDSHEAQPRYEGDAAQLAQDMQPFEALIKNHQLAAIMPAYVLYPTVDPRNPAGLSPIWLQKILRHEMGFDGVIMSDCLSMKGAGEEDLTTRAQRALEAGCDMLILCNQSREALVALFNETFPQTQASLTRVETFRQACLKGVG